MSSTPCIKCQKPMHQYEMLSHTFEECDNKNCSLYKVTLKAGDHATLTDEQIAAYEESVMRIKKSAADGKGKGD
jgi:uncharacterized protein YpbB